MNSFYKISLVFVALFSILSSTSICSEWSSGSHVIFTTFTHEVPTKNSMADRVHSDFSHDSTRSDFAGHGLSGRTNNFEKYTPQDFQHYFVRSGYTEREILYQRCLYMHDEFVKYAQTYSGYKDTIQKLYAELKNLNLIQKAYCVVKGTYCKGLQDRIAYLYKELNTIKVIPQDSNFYKEPAPDKLSSNTKVTNSDPAVFAEQFAEYKALECIYDIYVPCLAKAINARLDIYRDIATKDSLLDCVKKSYNLINNVKRILSYYGHELVPFTECFGNQLQQVIHQESLNILDCIDTLRHDSLLYDHQEALVDFAVAMVDYNHAGLIDKAMSIGDLCWTLLDYGQAIAEGAALGVYSAVGDILTNPIEATVCLVAGKEVLAYQLCKVLYNVADIGATAMSDYDRAKEKWNKYAEPLNNIIAAIKKKEITIRDAIKGGTAFVVGYRAQGKLLGGLGKFCTTIKHKSINFVKNSPLLEPVEYLTTPEGLLFKSTVQSNKFKNVKQSAASNLKNNINDKIAKNQNVIEKVFKTTKEMTQEAEKLGFTKTNYKSSGQPVFKKGNRYISPDRDSHNGGVWKMADSVKNLGSRTTRMGTYDKCLNRIGD